MTDDERQAIILRGGGQEVMGRLSALSQRPPKLSQSRNASPQATCILERGQMQYSSRKLSELSLRLLASPWKSARARMSRELAAGEQECCSTCAYGKR